MDTIDGSTIQLKAHQRALLQKCISLENEKLKLVESSVPESVSRHAHHQDWFETKVGVLADRVGSGKSYVILSLLLSNTLKDEQENIINSYGFNRVVMKLHKEYNIIPTNVLVIPHNLSTQWMKYTSQFPGLKSIFVNKKTLLYPNIITHSFIKAEKYGISLCKRSCKTT